MDPIAIKKWIVNGTLGMLLLLTLILSGQCFYTYIIIEPTYISSEFVDQTTIEAPLTTICLDSGTKVITLNFCVYKSDKK
jgi:hypothetical protein